jgi:hypothetical protein
LAHGAARVAGENVTNLAGPTAATLRELLSDDELIRYAELDRGPLRLGWRQQRALARLWNDVDRERSGVKPGKAEAA